MTPTTGTREHPRFEVNAHADVAAGVVAEAATPQAVQNISLGGICIRSENVQDVGTVVDLVVTFPELDGARLEARGAVVWVNRDPPAEMGIRFLELDEARRDVLREYLRLAALPR